MAKIEKILEKNEKKLIISQFLSDSIRETDEQGNLKEDYIYIKKIPNDIKTKIRYYSMKGYGTTASKEMLKKYKQKGHSIEELRNINTENEAELLEFMLDVDFENLKTEEMCDIELKIAKCIIDHGINQEKHSFVDNQNKPIELNYETLNNIGNEPLMKYIIGSIKTFSDGLILGE